MFSWEVRLGIGYATCVVQMMSRFLATKFQDQYAKGLLVILQFSSKLKGNNCIALHLKKLSQVTLWRQLIEFNIKEVEKM
jgi:hypothetical protein